jgi:restriction system protein
MIPDYESIMLPLLDLLSDNEVHTLNECHNKLAIHFNLTDEEIRQLLPSGKQPTFRNRLGWARTYMQKAGLVESPKRANYKITDRGLTIMSKNLNKIDGSVLKEFPEFIDFQSIKKPTVSPIANTNLTQKDSPEEEIEYAYEKLKNDTGIELLNTIKSCSPDFFERLVIDLLISMGYGGSRKDAGEAMGKSGDGGIDGIIKEDKLGLDVIYLQAKRWENTVPIKEIRDFTGALASKKARKGIFITTSNFPKSAYEFITQVDYKIILIDGELLTELMFEYNLGVTVENTYTVKSIDSDYFVED